MVDELCDFSPKLDKDSFFDIVDVDIAYNESSIEYRDRHYQGSAVETTEHVCCGLWSVFINQFIYSNLYFTTDGSTRNKVKRKRTNLSKQSK